MSKTSEYQSMSRAAIEKRLALAEDVCRMYGWSPAHSPRDATDREKATYMLWVQWHEAAGPSATRPDRYPHLDDDAVEALAAERDAVRSEAVRRIAT
jgi:hypothetical protein